MANSASNLGQSPVTTVYILAEYSALPKFDAKGFADVNSVLGDDVKAQIAALREPPDRDFTHARGYITLEIPQQLIIKDNAGKETIWRGLLVSILIANPMQ